MQTHPRARLYFYAIQKAVETPRPPSLTLLFLLNLFFGSLKGTRFIAGFRNPVGDETGAKFREAGPSLVAIGLHLFGQKGELISKSDIYERQDHRACD
jgi:hypothetical protein